MRRWRISPGVVDIVSRATFGRRKGIVVKSKVRQLEGDGVVHGASKANDVQAWPSASRTQITTPVKEDRCGAGLINGLRARYRRRCAFVNMVTRRKAVSKVSRRFKNYLPQTD